MLALHQIHAFHSLYFGSVWLSHNDAKMWIPSNKQNSYVVLTKLTEKLREKRVINIRTRCESRSWRDAPVYE